MKPKNPQFENRVREVFQTAAFIQDLGIELTSFSPGFCETTLLLKPRHLQQDQKVHAGVQATIADHTAGGAAGTLIGDDEIVLTVEFKINLLRPARGHSLRCEASVLKAGHTLIIAESEVFALDSGEEKLVAKAMMTLAVVKKKN